MKKFSKILLIGTSVISSAIAINKTKDINEIENQFKLKSIENNSLTNKLATTSTSLSELNQKNKKLSKRLIKEINKIISLKDSVNNLDDNLKKENKKLASKNSTTARLIREKKQLEKEIENAKKLENELKLLSTKNNKITVSEIKTTLMRKKGNGGFVKTQNSNKIDAIKTNFKILDTESVAELGKKKVNIKFYNRKNNTLSYTDVQEIDFDKKNVNITSIIEVDRKKIEKGLYNVVAYVDGKKINWASTIID